MTRASFACFKFAFIISAALGVSLNKPFPFFTVIQTLLLDCCICIEISCILEWLSVYEGRGGEVGGSESQRNGGRISHTVRLRFGRLQDWKSWFYGLQSVRYASAHWLLTILHPIGEHLVLRTAGYLELLSEWLEATRWHYSQSQSVFPHHKQYVDQWKLLFAKFFLQNALRTVTTGGDMWSYKSVGEGVQAKVYKYMSYADGNVFYQSLGNQQSCWTYWPDLRSWGPQYCQIDPSVHAGYICYLTRAETKQ